MLGSLGVPEIIFLVVLALLIFGPKRLPEVGRTVGKGLSEFRRASSEIQRTINAELALEDDPRPVQYPRRVTLGETEAEASAPPRTPPAGALARGASWEDDPNADGPPVGVVDMAYVTPDPEDGSIAPAAEPSEPAAQPSPAPIEPS